ncbi:MAG: hypothetical protein H7067_00220 [Burkholderiales bacterium]|nr:hypothetical protein [Opitutaceae bacterium]
MNITAPSRRTVLIAGVLLLIVALLVGVPWLSPARGVQRSWDGVVAAIEDNDMEELGRYLGTDYKDGFDLDREGAIRLAKQLRQQFLVCTIRRESAELTMDTSGKSAVTRAVIRLGGHGTPVAQNAVAASAMSHTPTAFRWRRTSWKPWDWRLVSVDNPDASRALATFQRQAAQAGLLP